ncbi:MAG: PaaI family thioesterase [Gammaproteobacteria bacterium]
MSHQSLQDQYAPHNACFGCGPSNEQGLKIKSYPEGDIVVATWEAKPHHEAFPGMLNGGIIGALLDCHSNWTAAYHLMKVQNLETPPCTVTAYFNVSLHKPTPSEQPIRLTAQCTKIENDRAYIHAELFSGEKKCASCEGLFVAVKPGHPAYHRW